MTDTLVQREVHVRRIVTIDHRTAQALSDPVRVRILEVLRHRPMTADELTKVLGNTGQKRATTTIRHHLDALKSAGLIEATKMVEVRGAVMKYYAPTVRAYDFGVPPKLDENYAKLIQDTSSRLIKLLKGIHGDKKFMADFGKNIVTCAVCKGNHFREYAAMEIINHALAKALGEKDYSDFLSSESGTKTTNIKT